MAPPRNEKQRLQSESLVNYCRCKLFQSRYYTV